MINALVLSLKELLLLKGIPCDASASGTRGVKVGHALALGEPFCLLTVVFETIITDHAEHECLLSALCTCTLQLSGSAEDVSNGAVLEGLSILFNVAEENFGFHKLYLLGDIRNLK